MDDTSRRQETAHRQAIRQRNYRRVRDRALARLRKQYPDDYALLLEEERARDEAEGKSWLDISGRTKRTMGSAGAPNGARHLSEGRGNKQGEGDNGGEA
jgi:broad specificity phosphatase PhoE